MSEESFRAAREAFVEAQAAFTRVVALTLYQLDSLPLEDRRSGNQLSFFLQAAAIEEEQLSSERVVSQFRRLIASFHDHLEVLHQSDAQDS